MAVETPPTQDPLPAKDAAIPVRQSPRNYSQHVPGGPHPRLRAHSRYDGAAFERGSDEDVIAVRTKRS
jgi:hypothetical protein